MYIFIESSSYMKALYESFTIQHMYEEAKMVTQVAVLSHEHFYVTEDRAIYEWCRRENIENVLWLTNNVDDDHTDIIFKYKPLENIFERLLSQSVTRSEEILMVGKIPEKFMKNEGIVIVPLGKLEIESTCPHSLYELEYKNYRVIRPLEVLKPCRSLRPFILKSHDERTRFFDKCISNISKCNTICYYLERFDHLFVLYLLERVSRLHVGSDDKTYEEILVEMNGIDVEVVNECKTKKVRRWLKRKE